MRPTNLTTKPRFENANCKFYREQIPKTANIERILALKQPEGAGGLRKFRVSENLSVYVAMHKSYCNLRILPPTSLLGSLFYFIFPLREKMRDSGIEVLILKAFLELPQVFIASG